MLKILRFGSRTFVGGKKKYHSSKLELLALKRAVCEHFQDYLFYVPYFNLYTDYNPLTYIKTSCKVNATAQRWIKERTDFNLTLHYKPCMGNVVTDTLEDLQVFLEICSVDQVKAKLDDAVNHAHNYEA